MDALAKAEPEQIEEIVRPCGLGKKQVERYQCLHAYVKKKKYNGKVPDDFNELLKLPGVGKKKVQNLIMGECIWKAGDCHRYALYPT